LNEKVTPIGEEKVPQKQLEQTAMTSFNFHPFYHQTDAKE
jgi:hypothetical protein